MKKLDKLILSSFIGPFILTFLVVVFILLTQHMLKYFDDIIGKGLGADVIGQLLFYFAIFMTPIAMPLAVLLSSLIAFGNLGEHFELTAIKSSGISLVRTLVPIFFFVLVLTGFAFYVNNNMVPKAALEAYSLLYDIKQKKPALDLREGSFYDGIPNMNIKVNKKFDDGITIKGIIIYDHRKNDGNKEVTNADSGKMYTILNERYLKLELFNGYHYTEGASNDRDLTGRKSKGAYKAKPLTRTQFSKMQVVFDLSSFQLSRTDKKWFQGNRIMRNLMELSNDIDSINREEQLVRISHYEGQKSFFSHLRVMDSIQLPAELVRLKHERDSIARPLNATYVDDTLSRPVAQKLERKDSLNANVVASADNDTVSNMAKPKPESFVSKPTGPVVNEDDTVSGVAQHRPGRLANKRKPFEASANSGTQAQGTKPLFKMPKSKSSPSRNVAPRSVQKVEEKKQHKKYLAGAELETAIDSVLQLRADKNTIDNAASRARSTGNQLRNTQESITDYDTDRKIFSIQWHKILASSLACVAMFLIGAPLGAIIKKGGLGVPFLVSILFFIIYYLLTMTGEKWAKQGVIPVPIGVWAADVSLFLVGLIFLRQARLDARLFEADFYSVMLDKAKKWLIQRKLIKEPAL